jgi:hypothetical protein
MQTNTLSPSFTRLVRVLAVISIVPALFLPFYQALLHGGRSAAEIIPRSGAYATAHMIGAICILLAMFGIVALHLRYAERIGRIAPLSLMLSLLAQALYAGDLLIDGFFNPELSHFDPVTQTQAHSANFLSVAAHSASLQVLGAAIYMPILISLVYIVANVLLGIVIMQKRLLPWPIGMLFLVGGLILSIDLAVPMWVEVIGYAALGLAIAWSAFLLWREREPAALGVPGA